MNNYFEDFIKDKTSAFPQKDYFCASRNDFE